MDYIIKECKELDEKVIEYIHPSGLKVLISPKPGYFEKYAMFSVNYGSIDSKFYDEDGSIITVPAGIAHFLEHKLFEQEYGSVMDKFAELGSNPNAFTSFTQTSYLFSCTDSFEENFKLLLNYVQNPYLTEENVDKEKGIIGQEINMYQDNPGWVTMMNFLDGMYFNNPVKIDIAGSIESISQITPELLYKCYNLYYRPKNMLIVVSGDLDYKEVINLVNDNISNEWVNKSSYVARTILDDEPLQVKDRIVRQKMDISMPLFMLGFKDNAEGLAPQDAALKQTSMKILLEILFGHSSDFYDENYNEGLINDSFYTSYEIDRGFAFSSFEGESKNPEKVLERVLSCIRKAQREGINEKDYTRILNNFSGRYIKRFNSVENICRQYTKHSFAGLDVYDYYYLYDKITLDDVNKVLNECFDEDKVTIAITESDK